MTNSIQLSTKSKMFLGRILSQVVRTARKTAGLPSQEVVAKRNHIMWKLDLREAIDLSIYLFGVFEKDTTNTIRTILKPGDVYLDIGANIGAHAISAAALVGTSGQVVAVEPTDWAIGKLKANVELNPNLSSTISILQAFVSPTEKQLPDQIFSSWNFTEKPDHALHMGHAKTTKAAKVITLDELILNVCQRVPALIKIDVDGFEIDVLRSGQSALTKHHPTVFVEFAPYCLKEQGHDPKELFDLMSSFGYKKTFLPSGQEIEFNVQTALSLTSEFGGINILFKA